MRPWSKDAWTWAVLAWVGVIFFSSTSTALSESERAFSFISERLLPQFGPETTSYGVLHLLADKGVHISMFAVLGMLLWKTLPTRRKIPLVLLLGAIVGTCSELLQILFPVRDPAVTDVLINIAGTALGIAIIVASSRLRARTGALIQV